MCFVCLCFCSFRVLKFSCVCAFVCFVCFPFVCLCVLRLCGCVINSIEQKYFLSNYSNRNYLMRKMMMFIKLMAILELPSPILAI